MLGDEPDDSGWDLGDGYAILMILFCALLISMTAVGIALSQ